VAGDNSATATIYRVSDGARIRGLNARPDVNFTVVGGVDYSPQGNLVAVAYDDYSKGIELYNPNTGALVRTLPGGGYGVRFSRDGQMVIGARLEGPCLWRVSDGAVLHTFSGHGGLFSFSSDNSLVAIGLNPGPDDIRVFRTADGGLQRSITASGLESLWSVAFSPTEDLLVLAGSRPTAAPLPGRSSDEAIEAYRMDGSLAWSYSHTYGGAMQVSFSADGQTLMVAGGWDIPPSFVEDGWDTIQRFRPSDGALLDHFGPHRGGVHRVAFSPDSQLLVHAGSFVMQVRNVADGSVVHTFEHGAGSVEFSRDGTMMLGNVGNIGVWGVPGFALLHVLPGHNNGTTDAVFTPDGTMIASGGFDNRVKLRRIADSSQVWNQPVNSPPLTLAASPDKQFIAAGTRGSTVYLWRASDGVLLRTIPGVNVVMHVAFSPDSTTLAVAEDATFNNLKLYRVSDGALLRTFAGSVGFQKNHVAFTPDGANLVFTAGGQYIQFWRIADGALLREYDRETGPGPWTELPVAVSPDNRHFLYGREDHTVVMARNPFGPAGCYANCDQSAAPPVLNVGDFTCFLARFAAGDGYANCDQSTAPPVLNVQDFTCFLVRFASGCP
jgi:WD40 repeat protein